MQDELAGLGRGRSREPPPHQPRCKATPLGRAAAEAAYHDPTSPQAKNIPRARLRPLALVISSPEQKKHKLPMVDCGRSREPPPAQPACKTRPLS